MDVMRANSFKTLSAKKYVTNYRFHDLINSAMSVIIRATNTAYRGLSVNAFNALYATGYHYLYAECV